MPQTWAQESYARIQRDKILYSAPPLSTNNQTSLVSLTNLQEKITTKGLELGALLMQLLLFAPWMAKLAHIRTYVKKTVAQGWAKKGSVSI